MKRLCLAEKIFESQIFVTSSKSLAFRVLMLLSWNASAKSGLISSKGVSPSLMYTGTYPSLGGRYWNTGADSGYD